VTLFLSILVAINAFAAGVAMVAGFDVAFVVNVLAAAMNLINVGVRSQRGRA